MSSTTSIDNTLSDWENGDLAPVPFPSRMTEVEFIEWAKHLEFGRVEWVDSEVIFMSPVSARHVRIFCWLQSVLGIFVQARGLGEVIGSEFVVRLRTQKGLARRMPDLMFIRADRLHLLQENHFEGPLDLAIEIVSPDSKKRDWDDKLKEYESAGMQEYWIIDPLAERFEAFQLDQKDRFTSIYHQPAGTFKSPKITGFQIRIEWLWANNPPAVLEVLRGLSVIS